MRRGAAIALCPTAGAAEMSWFPIVALALIVLAMGLWALDK